MNEVHESVKEALVRDILFSYERIAQKFVGDALDVEVTRYRKEYSLASGRADLLFIGSDDSLHLVELKVVEGNESHIEQVEEYVPDLRGLQEGQEVPGSDVNPVLMAPGAESLGSPEVSLIDYAVSDILYDYFENTSAYRDFERLKPNIVRGGAGVLNLDGLVTYVYDAGGRASFGEVPVETVTPGSGEGRSALDGMVERSEGFGLLRRIEGDLVLTPRGYDFHRLSKDPETLPELIELARQSVKDNPFRTPMTYALCAMAEAVYEVLLYHNPAPKEEVMDLFLHKAMKIDDWNRETTQKRAFNMYAAAAEDLKLVNRMGSKELQITPYGLEVVANLQDGRANRILSTLHRNE